MASVELTVLDKAIELLKKGWTRGAFARDWEGEEVAPSSNKACCWCILGALQASEVERTVPIRSALQCYLQKVTGYDLIPHFNDQVCGSDDEAIRTLEAIRPQFA